MPAYPNTLKQTYDSTRVRISGLVSDEGGNATLWVRNTAPTEKYSFSIVHKLTPSQLATLENFYTTNKTVLFDFVMNDNKAVTYLNCLFTDAPQFVRREARGLDVYVVKFRQR